MRLLAGSLLLLWLIIIGNFACTCSRAHSGNWRRSVSWANSEISLQCNLHSNKMARNMDNGRISINRKHEDHSPINSQSIHECDDMLTRVEFLQKIAQFHNEQITCIYRTDFLNRNRISTVQWYKCSNDTFSNSDETELFSLSNQYFPNYSVGDTRSRFSCFRNRCKHPQFVTRGNFFSVFLFDRSATFCRQSVFAEIQIMWLNFVIMYTKRYT